MQSILGNVLLNVSHRQKAERFLTNSIVISQHSRLVSLLLFTGEVYELIVRNVNVKVYEVIMKIRHVREGQTPHTRYF